MAENEEPFADVDVTEEGFSIPHLKWRELLFIGALRADGEVWVRDPGRPLPPFKLRGLFPAEARFEVRRIGERAHFKRV